jgi:hypothetical protein
VAGGVGPGQWTIRSWCGRVASLAVFLAWLGPLRHQGGPFIYPGTERSDCHAFWPVLLNWDESGRLTFGRDHGCGLAFHRQRDRLYVELVLAKRTPRTRRRGATLETRVPLTQLRAPNPRRASP